MPTAVPPPPEEPRIAGVWIAPGTNTVFVKHVDGSSIQVSCAESGLTVTRADGEIHGWQQVWPRSRELQVLAQAQIEKHGRDRYPTIHEQLLKLQSEVGELADAWLKAGSANDAFRIELCDVALCVGALANKTAVDLDKAVRHLVERDTRTFD